MIIKSFHFWKFTQLGLAIGRMRKLALSRELNCKIWINPKWRQKVGVPVGAKTAKVSMRQSRTAVCRRWCWVWSSHSWFACQQTRNRDVTYALGIRNLEMKHPTAAENRKHKNNHNKILLDWLHIIYLQPIDLFLCVSFLLFLVLGSKFCVCLYRQWNNEWLKD